MFLASPPSPPIIYVLLIIYTLYNLIVLVIYNWVLLHNLTFGMLVLETLVIRSLYKMTETLLFAGGTKETSDGSPALWNSETGDLNDPVRILSVSDAGKFEIHNTAGTLLKYHHYLT